MEIDKTQAAANLNPQQQQALARLHGAATQLEGVFLDMMFKAMRDTVPQASIFGKESSAEGTFQEMLDEQRSQTMAQSGTLGIAKVLENQLRSSVLSDSANEAQANVEESQP